MLQKNCVKKEHFIRVMQKGIVRPCLPENFQAANNAHFGDMVYNVLPKWPFISVMLSHFENQII